ncbi:MAG: thioesterase domain-containing protein [Cyclobacteriaceae bacterium]
MSRIKLFCFPYSGGSSSVFNRWRTQLRHEIELRPIELAGRGSRMDEPFNQNLEELIDDVYGQIKAEVSSAPYALFGHSFGALICYQLIEKIKQNKLPKPQHVFFSGRGAPHLPNDERKMYHLMNFVELKDELINFGGTPKEFFDHPELMNMFLPVLKNDFKMGFGFNFSGDICKYDGDITVFQGKEEKDTATRLTGWKDYTSGICHIIYFNGGHFFLNDEMDSLANIINNTLLANKVRTF